MNHRLKSAVARLHPRSSAWAAFIVALTLSIQPARAQTVGRESDAAPPEAAFEALQAAFERGDYLEAANGLSEFVRARAAWERIAEANRLYGASLVMSGEVAAGKQILDRAVDRAPDAPATASAYYYRGKALEGLGNFPGAVLEYNIVWTRFDDHPLAAQAALDEARLAEKILQNPRRARDVYERFVDIHPNHDRTPDIRNYLAVMAERADDIETAVMLYENYAKAHRNAVGDRALNGDAAGPHNAMWRAATLAHRQLNDSKRAVSLYQAYAALPLADRGNGLITAARIAAGDAEAGNAEALFRQALEAKPETAWRMEFARWLRAQNDDAKANEQLLAVVNRTRNADHLKAALDALGLEQVQQYLDGQPTRLAVFMHYLAGFNTPDRRDEGRAVIDRWLARNDIEWKTTAARQWADWTNEQQDIRRVVQAADAEGLVEDSTAASLAAADRLLAIETAVAGQPLLRIESDNGTLVGTIQAAATTDGRIAVRARILDRRATPGADAWPDTGLELYVSMPDSETVRQIVFSPAASQGPVNIAFHENGDAVPTLPFDWAFRPHGDFGYEIMAAIPLGHVKIAPAADRILFEAAARTSTQQSGETQFITLFETGMRSAFRNNEHFGTLHLTDGFETIAAEKHAERSTYRPSPARDMLTESIERWAPYPDFPRAEFAARLRTIAEFEPLTAERTIERAIEQPADDAQGADPAPPATETVTVMVRTEPGTAARLQAIDIILDNRLDAAPMGMHAAASLARQIEADNAVELAVRALDGLLANGMKDEAAVHGRYLIEALPAHDPQLVDVLFTIAGSGDDAWTEFYRETAAARAQREREHFGQIDPATEQSRRALTKLARFIDPARSVAYHDSYLERHAASPQAHAVRHNRFLEMRRAEQDTDDAIQSLIAELEENPALVRSIPIQLVPGGPDGYHLMSDSLRNALPGAPDGLKPAILLALAQVHQRFRNDAQAMDAVQELVRQFADSPRVPAGKKLAVDLFSRGYFPPGTTQEQAEQTFRWLIELAQASHVMRFAELTGNVWKVAGHPAGRFRDFEDFGGLFLFSTRQNIVRANNMSEFLEAMYAAWPADGIGADDNLVSRASPFRGGTPFMLYRWGLLRAPVTGRYNFWHNADNWVGLEINGQAFNFPSNRGNGHFSVHLTQGLHLLRVAYGCWGGGHHMRVEWQPPGHGRSDVAADAFSVHRHPILLAAAAARQGAFGTAPWDAYLESFPNDSRGRAMRLETLALAAPGQAINELGNLADRYPDNPRYKALLADCRWRLGQTQDALRAFSELATRPVTRDWEHVHSRLARTHFLQDESPAFRADEYTDRIRGASAWTQWLELAARQGGASGELRARIEAADHLVVLEQQDSVHRQNIGRLNAAVAREKAQIESAEQLAANEDAEADVRREAAAAVVRARQRLTDLEISLRQAREVAVDAERMLGEFRAALGLRENQLPLEIAIDFARGHLNRGTLDAASIHQLNGRIWSAVENRRVAEPFLMYVLTHSADQGQIRWTTDRLIDLAMAGDAPAQALEILTAVGMRAPRDGQHAAWLRRACQLALESGDVYMFARNAHVLAQLHPEHDELSGFLDRLGEVFENAGNYVSAEAEYRRVLQHSSDPATLRRTRLSLARLYEAQDRSVDALKELAQIVALRIPAEEREAAAARRPVAAPEREAEEDAEALLMAVRSYLSLELVNLALDAYHRAAEQEAFAADVIPEYPLLMDLATAAVTPEHAARTAPPRPEERSREALPPAIVTRAQHVSELADAIMRFHQETMTARQVVQTSLLRADANMLMHNYPRAIEEIRAARSAAEDSAAAALADLKMGELHLATDNPDQALPVFRRLAGLNRRDVSPMALFWLGTTQLYTNQRTEAIESFRILWERYADSELVRQAIYTIARTYAEQGAFLDAIRLYEAVGAMNSLPREKVVPGDVLTVKVWDADYFLSTGNNVLPVEIRAPSGDIEELGLQMNRINNSLFLGTIRTELGAPAPGDGILQVTGTDIIYVTYQDRFRGLVEGMELTAEALRGERSTIMIEVAEDADIQVSPAMFTETDDDDRQDALFTEPTEDEKAEARRRAALSAQLERGEGTIRPGNDIYIRVQDANSSRTGEPDTIRVTAFTYTVEQPTSETQERDLAERYQSPRPFEASRVIPSNPSFAQTSRRSPPPDRHPRLDTVEVVLRETGPHTGIFYGTVKTAVNGPTAIASDHSGDRMAAHAIDGSNRAEDAWIGFIDGKPDKWIEVDMKDLHDVARVVWDRGEGADDRYMIDYTLTLRGDGQPVILEREGNDSAHNNEIILDEPVRCRWLRFTAATYEGDAPAIAQIQVFDTDGNMIIPPEISPLERAQNDILEFNVGDFMAVEMTDDVNISPGRPVTRVSNPLGVDFVDGQIDAVYLSYGRNTVEGSILLPADQQNDHDAIYARRTKQVRLDDVLQILISDSDLSVDRALNTVPCTVFSSSGDSVDLTAEELRPTAGIFRGRIQLSSNPAAKDDGNRLWARPDDIILMRYRDEENRNPGHAAYRYAAVYVARDALAYYPGADVAIETPYQPPESLTPPHIYARLVDPDLAVPGTDNVTVNILSFATQDQVSVNLLLRDLDGRFESRVPLQMQDRPAPAQVGAAAGTAARRLLSLDEIRHAGSGGGRLQADSAFTIPLAIAGDDILYMSYEDPASAEASARVYIPVASGRVIEDVQALGAPPIPVDAEATAAPILLEDPLQARNVHARTRQRAVLRDIARKKLHYRNVLDSYDASIRQVNRRIEALTAGTVAAAPQDNHGVPQAPDNGDQPPAIAETVGDADLAGPLGDDMFAASEELIRAAALRRDRDGMTQAMRALRQRLNALEANYDTAAVEEQILRDEEKLRAERAERADRLPDDAEQAAADHVTPDEPDAAEADPAEWYERDGWWFTCGGVVPGTTLVLQVDDPHITADTVTVQLTAIADQPPSPVTVTASRVAEAEHLFEARVATTAAPPRTAGDGTLSLAGTRYIVAEYADNEQSSFPTRHGTFLSLASDATVRITGPDFLESKHDHHLGEDIYVTVTDHDMNKTAERDYVWIEVTADTGDLEHVPLRETQPHSGVFRGSIPTRLGEATQHDGILTGQFGGRFTIRYVDELWRDEDAVLPPTIALTAGFVSGTDGEVEIFARQLRRGALQRDVLFNTARAHYEMGKSSTEMGASERGRRHLLESRDRFTELITLFPDDPICAHATYYQGNIHFLLDDVDRAVDSLQQVIDRWPGSEFRAMALFKLGACHMRTGRMDKAVEAFVNLAYHYPDSPLVADAMLTMAQQFSAQEMHDQAIGVGHAFIRKFPSHERTDRMYLRLAGWLMAEERLSAAATLLDEAVTQLPHSPLMPAFLYWHADCIFKTHSSRSNEYRRGIVMLQRVKYDYSDTQWARYAAARLTEVE